jgi:hypothetical protein
MKSTKSGEFLSRVIKTEGEMMSLRKITGELLMPDMGCIISIKRIGQQEIPPVIRWGMRGRNLPVIAPSLNGTPTELQDREICRVAK